MDRAVEQAAQAACRAEAEGDVSAVSAQSVLGAIDDQVGALVRILNPSNVAEYVDLPDGVRVAGVRRVDQPAVRGSDLQR